MTRCQHCGAYNGIQSYCTVCEKPFSGKELFRSLELTLRTRTSSCVYFLQAAFGGGPIKIGYSTNLALRLRELQNGSPFTLKCIGVLEGGTKETEKGLHQCFAALRTHGEWFWPCDTMLDMLKHIRKEGERNASR